MDTDEKQRLLAESLTGNTETGVYATHVSAKTDGPPATSIEAEADAFHEAAKEHSVAEHPTDARDDAVGDVIRVDAD